MQAAASQDPDRRPSRQARSRIPVPCRPARAFPRHGSPEGAATKVVLCHRQVAALPSYCLLPQATQRISGALFLRVLVSMRQASWLEAVQPQAGLCQHRFSDPTCPKLRKKCRLQVQTAVDRWRALPRASRASEAANEAIASSTFEPVLPARRHYCCQKREACTGRQPSARAICAKCRYVSCLTF